MQSDRCSDQAPLISVVIPACNAEATIAATLDSALAQTHRRIEIVVVDDGSSDRTALIAKAYAARDQRVSVISVPNGGVAAARNIAIAASSGFYVAPLDADDLWHPTMLEKQLAAIQAAGEQAGFAYAFFRRIDMDGRVLRNGAARIRVGRVFTRLLFHNFVGNGSGLLVRRDAIEQIGGYDPVLKAMGVEGCEDYLLQLRIAASWTAAVTPEFLIGYRVTPSAMSANRLRMLSSSFAALRIVEETTPGAPARAFAIARAARWVPVGILKIRLGKVVEGFGEIMRGFLAAPAPACATLLEEIRERARGLLRRFGAASPGEKRPHFHDMDPTSDVPALKAHPLDRWVAELSAWEGRAPLARAEPAARSAVKEYER